jgi:hypothetical protein
VIKTVKKGILKGQAMRVEKSGEHFASKSAREEGEEGRSSQSFFFDIFSNILSTVLLIC